MIGAPLFVTPRSWPAAQEPVTAPGQPGSVATPAECVRRVGQHFPDIWPRLDRLRVKQGKVKGIRFATLEAICQYLDCQPGDLMEYNSEFMVSPA